MSETASAQTSRRGFKPAPVQQQPGLACIGYVDEVGEGHVSKTEKYVVQPVHILGIKGSRSTTVQLLYRPEWLKADFDPDQIEAKYDEKTAKSLLFVYRKMFGTSGRIGALEGICGSPEAYQSLTDAILALPEISTDAVRNVLHQFLIKDNAGMTCGYTLKQRSSKLEDLGENGKSQYVLEEGYEINEFFHPTEKNIKSQVTRAAKSEGKFRVAFETE